MGRLFFDSMRPRLGQIAQEFDLAPMQLQALKLLEPGREAPMSALAESLSCDASNVTGIVDRLEGRGLIERRGAPHDRRVKILALTGEGERMRQALLSRMSEPPPEIARLSRSDQRTLRDALRKTLEAAPQAGARQRAPAPRS